MLLTGSVPPRFASRFGLLGLMALVLALPYAVPPLGERLLGKDPGAWIYLVKPVENQAAFLPIGLFTLAVPFFILRTLAPPRRLPRSSVILLAGLVTAFQLVSVFGAPSPGASLRSWMLPLSGLCGLLILTAAEADRRAVEKLMFLAVLSAVPAAIYAIAQSQGWEFLPYRDIAEAGILQAQDTTAKQRVSSTFGHPNFLGSYLAPLVLWCLYFALAGGSRLRRAAGIGSFLVLVTALVLAGTRAAWLGIATAFIPFYLALALTPAYRRQLLFAGGVAVAVGLALVAIPNPLLRVNFDFRERLFASREITDRFYYWTVANRMFFDRPLMGVGYGGFDPLYFEYVARVQRSPLGTEAEFLLRDNTRLTRAGSVHNDHLQIAVEGGMVTAFAWIGLWTALLGQMIETIRQTRREGRVALLAATFLASLGAMGVDALFGFPFHLPVSGLYFWLLVGCWGVWRGFGGGTSRGECPVRIRNS